MTRLSTQDCLSSSLSDGEFALDFFSFKIFFFKFVYVFVLKQVVSWDFSNRITYVL